MQGSKKIRYIITAIVVLAGAAAVWRWQSGHTAAPSTQANSRPMSGHRGMMPNTPSPVQVAKATYQAVPHYLTGLGTVTAANTATVRSRVDGQLMAIHFKEGQQVKAGDLLAELDPSQFQVTLAQAQGQLARDQATLANAKRDLARYQQLAKSQVVSRQEIDTQQALVAESEGTVRADQAAVASAELQLNWSRITAPIDGRVGLRQIDVGNQVSSSDSNGVVVITQTQPIDAVFTVPEGEIAKIVSAQEQQKDLEVEAWDRANHSVLAKGTLLSLDNQIDTTTGTLKAKARFTNQDNSLFPNQFVNIKLLLNTQQDAIVIPASALQMGSEGHFVWVVDAQQKVSKKNVEPGLQNAQIVVIESGLPVGTQVVTDGVDRLKEGAQVDVVSPFERQAAKQTTPQPKNGATAP